MSADGVSIESEFFEPIRVTEDHLEGLLPEVAPTAFPGYEYFDFKPVIRCGEGSRSPDGALLSRESKEWFVVEVESHTHSVDQHIEPQLGDLSQGYYGPEAFGYLDRYHSFDRGDYKVNTEEPGFLLIIDSLTPEVRQAASRTGFQAVECSVFRSDSNRYAVVVTGARPRLDLALKGPGMTLRLEDNDHMATLVPTDGKKMPRLSSEDVLVGEQLVQVVRLSDGSGIVLPLSPGDVQEATGGKHLFRLTRGRLVADEG